MKVRFLLLVVSLILMAAGASASCGVYCYGNQGYSASGYVYYAGTPSYYGGAYGNYDRWNGYESWDFYSADGRYYSYYGPSYYGSSYYGYNYNYPGYNNYYSAGYNQYNYYYPSAVYYHQPYYNQYDYRVQYYEPGFSISVGW